MRAALVGVNFGKGDFDASLEELSLLSKSAGAAPVTTIVGKRASPDAAFFVGSGKADEIANAVTDHQIDIVIFNHALSPAQQRNLERRLSVRVVDRTSLILDIFAQRAQSHEGKVQVELAQLQHLATRLIRGWTHLERQKGGIGLRGPGETQLETDRRLLGDRVKALRSKLNKLHRQRATQRRARDRADTFSVSLVGYTNAGKSTLFNALTQAGVLSSPKMFATLDPTIRAVTLPSKRKVLLSDTVGFIRNLPHTLVSAFRATLEEVQRASLILHVSDASSRLSAEQDAQVEIVLKELEVEKKPRLRVMNKVDLLDVEVAEGLVNDALRQDAQTVYVSAVEGTGLDRLLARIDAMIDEDRISRVHLRIPQKEGKTLAMLEARARIYSRKYKDGAVEFEVDAPESVVRRVREWVLG